ncbi:MAG: HlyD family efflux transporter periplasmic adaptor subunit [Acidobacteriota bacterium]|nr:HlyD family efflux transporter periplasmic adaptor subunit [Acidobacteriota bacterium]
MSAASPAPASRYVAAARRGRAAEALEARHGVRLDRPGLRGDLVIRRQVQVGEVTWVVKQPEANKFYTFDDGEWGLIELFDGTRTRTEILEEYRRRIPGAAIALPFVLDYEEMLRKIDLLEQSAVEKNLQLLSKFKNLRQRAAEERAEGFNVLFMLFKVFDPDRILTRTLRYVRWLWRPPVVAVACLTFVFTIAVFATRFDVIWAQTIELYSFLKKPFWDFVQFWVILTGIGCIHEFGHGYATKMYGGEVHDMGIALLYFTPAFYCDTTDSLLFPNKWQKLTVTVAGIYIEAILCTIATVLWVASYPDTLLHELAYKTMLFTGVSTVFFNINPLVKIDGYYALCSLTEIPELREESFRWLGALFQRHVLRLNVEVPVVSRRKKRIFLVYGPLALVYIGFIMAFIAKLLDNLYAKVVPDLAVVLLLVTLYFFFRKRVRLVLRISRLFYLDKKELVMSPRARLPLLAAAAGLVLILAVPWGRRTIRMDAILEPAGQVKVEAPEDGTVREVLAREGDILRKGQPLFRIESPGVAADLATLSARHAGAADEKGRSLRAGDAGQVYRAERREGAAAAGLALDAARAGRLAVPSPIAGRLLTARAEDLVGKWVTAGTVLGTVGDTGRLSAAFPVSERLLTDLAVGAPVSMQLHGRPFRILRGEIVSIAPASRPAASDDASALRPSETPGRIVAVARFENPDGDLKPGLGGVAKIRGPRASLLGEGFRILSRWFSAVAW